MPESQPTPQKIETLPEAWQRYKKLYLDGMTVGQESQLHRAFFAGAIATLDMALKASELPTEEQAPKFWAEP